MKTLLYIFLTLLISNSISIAQIPQDYPFKTYLDETGNLYITGVDNGDIFTKKFPPIDPVYNDPLWNKVLYNSGDDRGYDIALDPLGSIYVAGYIFNVATNSNDLIIIKHNRGTGDTIWTRKYGSYYDDKAFGIVLDEDQNIYIAGYKSNKNSNKNLLVLKYNVLGDLIYQHEYNNPVYKGDDVGTDILVDKGFVYVAGYTYQGERSLNDIILLTYPKDSPVPSDTNIYRKNGTNETPTSFLITYMSNNRIAKSRLGVSSVTENLITNIKSDYLTLYFNGDQYNTLAWAKTFNGTGNGNDVATDLSTDGSGNLYVTGYSNRSIINPYDFATIKYNYSTGSYGWNDPIKYFNYGTGTGDDRASSIKFKNNKIYVSGTSQDAPNGIYTKIYEQNEGVIIQTWDRVFYPSFTKSDTYGSMNKASKIELDSSGNLIVIAFAWNNTESKFAVIKYDSLGNVLYTIDETQTDNLSTSIITEQNSPEQYELGQNFPNPFNPNTKIYYSIPKEGNVRISVYNIAGQEIADLVNEFKSSGQYEIEFDGSNYASGIYFYKIESGEFSDTRRMILAK